jgi:hypothetical protein
MTPMPTGAWTKSVSSRARPASASALKVRSALSRKEEGDGALRIRDEERIPDAVQHPGQPGHPGRLGLARVLLQRLGDGRVHGAVHPPDFPEGDGEVLLLDELQQQAAQHAVLAHQRIERKALPEALAAVLTPHGVGPRPGRERVPGGLAPQEPFQRSQETGEMLREFPPRGGLVCPLPLNGVRPSLNEHVPVFREALR